jgi:hypothetical protein
MPRALGCDAKHIEAGDVNEASKVEATIGLGRCERQSLA